MSAMNSGEPLNAGSVPTHSITPSAGGGRIAWSDHQRYRRRGVLWACVAASALSLVYLGVLAIANSLDHAASEFVRLWPWMVSLVAGFALQVGLFGYVRSATRGTHGARAAAVATSGGTSTLSMVACCAHHLTDVLPAIGLAGTAVFLASYQPLFLLLGLLSNLVGLVYVLGIVRRHGLFPCRRSLLSMSVHWPVDRALPYVLVLSIIGFTAAVIAALV